eukprot:7400819-Pyramimonas_sp.AAC.1
MLKAVGQKRGVLYVFPPLSGATILVTGVNNRPSHWPKKDPLTHRSPSQQAPGRAGGGFPSPKARG